MAKTMKVPKGMKKLSPDVKSEKSMGDYKYDPRPCFSLELKDLPEMKDWKVGQEYSLEIKVKMEEYRSSIDNQSGKEKTKADFRITAIGVDSDSDKD